MPIPSAPPPEPARIPPEPEHAQHQQIERHELNAHLERLVSAWEAKEKVVDAAYENAVEQERVRKQKRELDLAVSESNKPKIADMIDPATGNRPERKHKKSRRKERER